MQKKQVLLEAGVDPNIADKEGMTPLHEAINGGFVRTARLLLWHDATDIHATTKTKDSALDFAITSQKMEILEMLLSYDFSIHERWGVSCMKLICVLY